MRSGMTTADERKARLAAELRANLHRRKAQARASTADAARAGDTPPSRPSASSPGDQPDI
ncbi:hypothetical protein ASE86_12185 [Sphingomonas sp. Leaf33]|uniref:hypothetical protein n=1 Tax=Sphingomonas sp. Leaf33 TaxID=1736215 RepID=UPI0006FE21C6|nr:hypothetical protein [Sphingomonas sp. Leaf33]KQN19267.1 hypothetical protein ASE86_12185 [Sphingomonas sp. Leaf33]